MSLNGKRKDFVLADILSVQHLSRKFTPKYVSGWNALAEAAKVPHELIENVSGNLRLTF